MAPPPTTTSSLSSNSKKAQQQLQLYPMFLQRPQKQTVIHNSYNYNNIKE
jgi:hypothetical protein